MLTRDFHYHLPAHLVAQEPVPRGESRLLVVDRPGAERHRWVHDLPGLLRPGDLLVLNNTRVLPARLFAERRGTGAKIEILLAERRGDLEWDALLKPGKKARPGTVLELGEELCAEVLGRGEEGGRFHLRFSVPPEPFLERLGHVPLPPYIKRPDTEEDRSRYQTVYARHPGAIAAPTAGLHFSRELLAEITAAQVEVTEITLHVGLGTFKPVTTTLVHEHEMDRESYLVPDEAAQAIAEARRRGGRVVAVGTTVVRALESAASLGREGEARGAGLPVPAGAGSTRLFITPGYRFRVVDALLTNFHLPCSTLLMLVSAFAGRERVLAAYREAIEEGYRFYSFGDAMLVEHQPTSPGASTSCDRS